MPSSRHWTVSDVQWNDTVRAQLTEYIAVPTVLQTDDGTPYEYSEHAYSPRKLKRRRVNRDIPLELFSFLLENDVDPMCLREFSSGLFLNYVEIDKIYG